MNTIYNKITESDFIKINKKWFSLLGVNQTLLLFELLDEENYWIKNSKIGKDGFFYSTDPNIQKIYPWTSPTIRKILNELKDLKLIQMENRGMPRVRHIKINRDVVYKFSYGVENGFTLKEIMESL